MVQPANAPLAHLPPERVLQKRANKTSEAASVHGLSIRWGNPQTLDFIS
jgi:hypothetical protein